MGGVIPNSALRVAPIAAAILFVYFTLTLLLHPSGANSENHKSPLSSFFASKYQTSLSSSSTFDPQRDSHKYGLSDSQCDAAFPGLFDEITESAARRRDIGNVTRKELDAYATQGISLRAMIHSGRLYIIHHEGVMGLDWVEPRARATLHSIYRALTAAENPKDIPDVEFVLCLADSVQWAVHELPPLENKNITPANSAFWAFSRREEDNNVWLMPDFGFWNWGKMSTLDSIKTKAEEIERHVPFASKINKLLWRGRVWVAPDIRQPIIDNTREKEWSDVVELNDDDPQFRAKWVEPADHCKWRYLLYAEGVSYSGRLKYLQNCHSVILSPPMHWITPMRRLLRPSGPTQNFVQVASNFSNLSMTMETLLADPDESYRIANNSATMFKNMYNSPAAEACYWRRLIREWSTISEAPMFYEYEQHEPILPHGQPNWGRKWRGVPFEDFAIDWPRGD